MTTETPEEVEAAQKQKERLDYQQNKTLISEVNDLKRLIMEDIAQRSQPTRQESNDLPKTREGNVPSNVDDALENMQFQLDYQQKKAVRSQMDFNSLNAVTEAMGSNKFDIEAAVIQEVTYHETLFRTFDGQIKKLGKKSMSSRLKPIIWPIAIAVIIVGSLFAVMQPGDLEIIINKLADPRAQVLMIVAIAMLVIGTYLVIRNNSRTKVSL